MNMFKKTVAKTPAGYIAGITDPKRKADVKALHALIQKVVPTLKPHVKYAGMLGYGSYHYKTKSGREGDWMIIGLANQKNYISLYVCAVDAEGKYIAEKYKKELTPASVGKSCIRFKRLSDMNITILTKVIREGAKAMPQV